MSLPFPFVECVLIRHVFCGKGYSGTFQKKAVLPLGANPSEVHIRPDSEEADGIHTISTDLDGKVTVYLDPCTYGDEDFAGDDEVASQFAWETDGWELIPPMPVV